MPELLGGKERVILLRVTIDFAVMVVNNKTARLPRPTGAVGRFCYSLCIDKVHVTGGIQKSKIYEELGS
jgi:hypothetical protein